MSSHRKEAVQELRALARDCGVDRVRDDASREKVMQMVGEIRKQRPGQEMLAKLENAFSKYQGTFAEAENVAAAAGAASAASARDFRLRGTSFLFTYNWDFLNKPLPDGTPAPATEQQLWRMWRAWKACWTSSRLVLHSSKQQSAKQAHTRCNSIHCLTDRVTAESMCDLAVGVL